MITIAGNFSKFVSHYPISSHRVPIDITKSHDPRRALLLSRCCRRLNLRAPASKNYSILSYEICVRLTYIELALSACSHELTRDQNKQNIAGSGKVKRISLSPAHNRSILWESELEFRLAHTRGHLHRVDRLTFDILSRGRRITLVHREKQRRMHCAPSTRSLRLDSDSSLSALPLDRETRVSLPAGAVGIS